MLLPHSIPNLCQTSTCRICLLKGLEHKVLGWKVLIYKYNLDMSISEEM